MTDKDIIINNRLMEEFNLEPGSRRRVYDHDTGELKTVKGKEMVVPGAIPGKFSVEFDPINSVRQMNLLFGSYVESLEETGVLDGSVVAYCTMPSNVPGKVKAVIKINPDDGGPIQEISSKPYKNETSAYADLVCRINGDESVDMTEYDYDRRKPTPMKFNEPKKRETDKKTKKPTRKA